MAPMRVITIPCGAGHLTTNEFLIVYIPKFTLVRVRVFIDMFEAWWIIQATLKCFVIGSNTCNGLAVFLNKCWHIFIMINCCAICIKVQYFYPWKCVWKCDLRILVFSFRSQLAKVGQYFIGSYLLILFDKRKNKEKSIVFHSWYIPLYYYLTAYDFNSCIVYDNGNVHCAIMNNKISIPYEI